MRIIDPQDGIEVDKIETQYTVQTPSGVITMSPSTERSDAQREKARADAALSQAGSVETSILLTRKAHYTRWKEVE